MAYMKTMVNAFKSDWKVMALFWLMVGCAVMLGFLMAVLARMFI